MVRLNNEFKCNLYKYCILSQDKIQCNFVKKLDPKFMFSTSSIYISTTAGNNLAVATDIAVHLVVILNLSLELVNQGML